MVEVCPLWPRAAFSCGHGYFTIYMVTVVRRLTTRQNCVLITITFSSTGAPTAWAPPHLHFATLTIPQWCFWCSIALVTKSTDRVYSLTSATNTSPSSTMSFIHLSARIYTFYRHLRRCLTRTARAFVTRLCPMYSTHESKTVTAGAISGTPRFTLRLAML